MDRDELARQRKAKMHAARWAEMTEEEKISEMQYQIDKARCGWFEASMLRAVRDGKVPLD